MPIRIERLAWKPLDATGFLLRHCLEIALTLAAENFFHQWSDLGRWIGSNLSLFLAQHEKQSVESLSDHVVCDVETLRASKWQCRNAARQMLELLYNACLIRCGLYGWLESSGKALMTSSI